MNFSQFFTAATGIESGPFDYQKRLAEDPICSSRLIEIPTGLGNTAAVVLAWLWNRVALNREEWPRRLVYCLPMRTLVEQTSENVREWLQQLDDQSRSGILPLVRSENDDLAWLRKNSPIILMGGEDPDRVWDIHPEKPAIIMGTQDMLLSRALNSGYGMSRDRWPMHFGLLNNDCLWVMDETQLMGVAVETSAQLDAVRSTTVNCPTWWMSATLDQEWGSVPELTAEQRALVDELVADGLSIQHKFKPEPLYKNTGKGHYEGDTVAEIRRAREASTKKDEQE